MNFVTRLYKIDSMILFVVSKNFSYSRVMTPKILLVQIEFVQLQPSTFSRFMMMLPDLRKVKLRVL